MNVTTQESRQYLNALKTGVVPNLPLSSLMVGREPLLQEFGRSLQYVAGEESMVRFLSGPYGSGKTFFLTSLQQKALEQGFVTASLQAGSHTRLNNFHSFYYSVMHNLHSGVTGKENKGFESIFDAWIAEKRSQVPEKASQEIMAILEDLNCYNSSFARAFSAYIRARIRQDKTLAQGAVSWMTGEENVPHQLKAQFDVIGRIDKHNALDFLRAFARLVVHMGYFGLVVLVDEVESLVYERSDLRKVAYDNLRHLIDQTYGGGLPNCLLVFAGTPRLYDDPEKGIVSHEALSQRLGISIDRVVTPQSVSDLRQPVISLPSLTQEELLLLTERVVALYRKAYDYSTEVTHGSLANWTMFELKKTTPKGKSLSMREYLTKLIEVLDLMQQHPDKLHLRWELER